MRQFLASSALIILLAGALSAAEPKGVPFGSVAILELFTSEGCSSCPPADALLRRVNLKNTASGQLLVGISEHVTYWNRLGWKDSYSLEAFTERQNTYAGRLGVEAPYTPQMVVNGREQFVGSDSEALSRALQLEAKRPSLELRIAATLNDAGMIDVEVDLHGHAARALEVMAVIADDVDRSNVLKGENAGNLLQHVAVARTLERIGTVTEPGQQRLQVHVPDSLRTAPHGGHHLIVFLQEPRQGSILGAATVAL